MAVNVEILVCLTQEQIGHFSAAARDNYVIILDYVTTPTTDPSLVPRLYVWERD